MYSMYVCIYVWMCQGKRVLHRVFSGVQGQFRIIFHRIFRAIPLYNASTYYHYHYYLSISAAPSQWQHQVQCIPSDMSENRPERGHAGGRPLLAIETQHQNRPQLRRPGGKNSRHTFIHTYIHKHFIQDKYAYKQHKTHAYIHISYRTNINTTYTYINTSYRTNIYTYNIHTYIHIYILHTGQIYTYIHVQHTYIYSIYTYMHTYYTQEIQHTHIHSFIHTYTVHTGMRECLSCCNRLSKEWDERTRDYLIGPISESSVQQPRVHDQQVPGPEQWRLKRQWGQGFFLWRRLRRTLCKRIYVYFTPSMDSYIASRWEMCV